MTRPGGPLAEDEAEQRLLEVLRASGTEADEALLQLFELHRTSLMAWLVRQGALPDEREDLVQEAFIKAREGLSRFEGDCKLITWIYVIARHLLRDAQKKRKREVHLDPVYGGGDSDQDPLDRLVESVGSDSSAELSAEESFELKRLQACLKTHYPTFTRDHPEAAEDIEWIVTEGWTVRELAKLRDVDESAMRKRMERTRGLIGRYLQPCAGYFSGKLL